MKIRSRAYLLGLAPALLVAAILGVYLGASRLDDLEASLRQRGQALAAHVAQGAEYAVVSGNQEPLRLLLAWTAREQDVVHAAVYLADGSLLQEVGRAPSNDAIPFRPGVVETRWGLVASAPVVLTSLAIEDPFLQSEGETTDKPIAWVRIDISKAGNAAIARTMLLTTLGIVFLGVAFAALLVHRLALVGIQPLMEIITAVRGIASGNFQVRLPITAKSELGSLQQGINQMSEALQSFQEDMQRRVDAATAGLAEQKEAAERANQAKSRFLAAASHDLRQPMHAIALYVASMKPQVAGREASHTLGKIDAAVAAMENLFGAILDVSKLDAGVVAPEIACFSARAMLEDILEVFRAEAAEKGLALRLRCGEVFARSDVLLLGRILLNLISNALRYTQRGGVLVAARRHGGAVRFQVWDTGKGIAPEHLEQVFQEFFQVSNSQRDRSQGLGLGLAIVDRLARLLGHSLAVRSLPDKGTVFSLDVPCCPGNSTPRRMSEEALEGRLETRALVAVVDDDAMALDSLVTLLEGWGLRVVRAASGTALRAELNRAPDILISDYRLDGEDGLHVAEGVGRAFPGASFPTIIVTGDTSEPSIRALGDSGFPVLHKPVRPARLRALINHLLKKG